MTGLYRMLGLLFAIAGIGVAVGIGTAGIPPVAKRIVSFSGGVLIGIALFWVLPEIAAEAGWLVAVGGAAAGFGAMLAIDRFVSGEHKSLLVVPLVTAASVHSFFDGWTLTVSQELGSHELKTVFLAGIGVHKFPEGVALGVLLLSATGSAWKAGIAGVLAQCAMFGGALTAGFLASHLAPQWGAAFLAMAAGVFFYLGYHAVEDRWREEGGVATFLSALTGAAGAAALRLVPGY